MTYNMSPISIIASTINGNSQGTVENIQNAAVHEGTHLNGVSGQGAAHARSYQIQIEHPTFKNTTPEFKKEIKGAYEEVKAGRL